MSKKSAMDEILADPEQTSLLLKIMPKLCAVLSDTGAMASEKEVEAFRHALNRAGFLKTSPITWERGK